MPSRNFVDWVLENIMELLPIQSGDDDGIKAIWERDLLLEARTMLSKGNMTCLEFKLLQQQKWWSRYGQRNCFNKYNGAVHCTSLSAFVFVSIKKKKKTQTLIQK